MFLYIMRIIHFMPNFLDCMFCPTNNVHTQHHSCFLTVCITAFIEELTVGITAFIEELTVGITAFIEELTLGISFNQGTHTRHHSFNQGTSLPSPLPVAIFSFLVVSFQCGTCGLVHHY